MIGDGKEQEQSARQLFSIITLSSLMTGNLSYHFQATNEAITAGNQHHANPDYHPFPSWFMIVRILTGWDYFISFDRLCVIGWFINWDLTADGIYSVTASKHQVSAKCCVSVHSL